MVRSRRADQIGVTCKRDDAEAILVTASKELSCQLFAGLANTEVVAERAKAAAWYVEFSWQGMPLRWTALEAGNPRLPAQGWQVAEVSVAQRPLLIPRKLLAADGRKPGELLTQNVGILLSTAR